MKTNLKFLVGFCCLVSLACESCTTNDDRKTSKNISGKSDDRPLISTDYLLKSSIPEMGLDNFYFSKDTVCFTSPISFLYFPLGEYKKDIDFLKDHSDLELSRQEYSDNAGPIYLYKFRNGHNFIKMIRNEESGFLDIVYARILDSNLVLQNNIAVGMSKSSFCQKFFRSKVNLRSYNAVKIQSLILGVTHIYSFKGDKLEKIIVDSDYQVDKD